MVSLWRLGVWSGGTRGGVTMGCRFTAGSWNPQLRDPTANFCWVQGIIATQHYLQNTMNCSGELLCLLCLGEAIQEMDISPYFLSKFQQNQLLLQNL